MSIGDSGPKSGGDKSDRGERSDVTVTIHAQQAQARRAVQEPPYLLVVEAGSSAQFPLPARGELVIGRAPEVQVRLHDPSASRQHARLTGDEAGYALTDLGSHNGTRINGERLNGTRRLLTGDVISICDVTLIFHDPGRATLSRPLHDDATLLRGRLEEEVERALCFQRAVSIVAVHLGGLSAGDRPGVGAALLGQVRLMDMLAWGGRDHLLVLLPDLDGPEVEAAAARLIKALSPLAASAKAGFASCPNDGYHADALLLGARAAMEQAEPGQVRAAAAAVTTLRIGERSVVVADPAMLRLYSLLDRLAPSDLPVLICGETGTGKEIAAQALHTRSRRSAGRLVSLNCAALPETLAESELFGHEKGAFTGAVQTKMGILESAQGGTVFLDEIGELPLSLQAKLLRALESKRITRVGDVRERIIDIRIVAATNRRLADESAQGRFRQDLYFRLSGAVLMLPPLRDRPRELPILARTFLAEACARADKPAMLISPAAMELLLRYPWPGNLRELRNAMDYAAATAQESVLEPAQLPAHLLESSAQSEPRAWEAASITQLARSILRMSFSDKLSAIEEALITEALALAKGNKSAAARLLGVHRKVIERRLDKKPTDELP